METFGKRSSLIGLELPFVGFVGIPSEVSQAMRQNLAMKYSGIPFGDPGFVPPVATGSYGGRIGRGLFRGVWG